jgi:hypothetical protein
MNTVENTSFVWMKYVNFLLRCHAETGLSEVTFITRHELGLDRPVSASSSSDNNVIYIASAFSWYIKRNY